MPNLEKIGELVSLEAELIFDLCGAEKDFCVQHVGASAVVFGGTNRLVFNVRSGWRADRSYCTPRFLEAWDRIKHEYRA